MIANGCGGGGLGELEGEKGQHLNTTPPSFLFARKGAQFHPGQPFFHLAWMCYPLAGLAGSCCPVFAVVGLQSASRRSVKASQQLPNHHFHDMDDSPPRAHTHTHNSITVTLASGFPMFVTIVSILVGQAGGGDPNRCNSRKVKLRLVSASTSSDREK